MQASRRKGSMGEKEPSGNGAAPARSQTPSRQLPDRKNANSVKTGNARSSSAPKQRGKGGAASSSSSGTTGSTATPPMPYDVALAKMTKASEGKSEDELQQLLQRLLQTGQFRDAAYLIAASPALSARFKTSDVVRLMLEAKQFEQTAQLIREMQLQSNQLLVTLFVKELVRSAQFHAAMRYAQELVQNFGKKDFGPREQERPSWTPQALIQAMVRASQFKTALKFAKQFALLETFPALPLVASMFDARQWDDAVSSVMEYRLFADFPIDALVVKMLGERQWSLAVKCMGKLQDKEQHERFADALVREAARAGDFVIALRYLREFKLDDVREHRALLEYLVDTMVTFSEMYKAIKYAIKFGLDGSDTSSGNGSTAAAPLAAADTSADTRSSRYATSHLIRQAIAIGQFHVATFYIKKLRLKDVFTAELDEIEQRKQVQLQEFRDFVGFREAQYSHPATQHQLYALLGDRMETDADWVELEPAIREIVLTETVEVIPRRKRTVEVEQKTGDDSERADVVDKRADAVDSRSHDASSLEASRPEVERQSRFNFARTSVSDVAAPTATLLVSDAGRIGDASSYERTSAPQPPPGLAPFATATGDARADESSSTFNFAAFASAVQSSAAPAPSAIQLPVPTAQSQGPPGLQAIQQPMQMQLQQHAGMFAQRDTAAGSHFGQGSVAPPPPPPPPSAFAPSYHQSSGFLQSQAPPSSYMMPLSMSQQSPSGGFPGMDIASLAMQFHSGGGPGPLGAPVYGGGGSMGSTNVGGGVMGYPLQMPPPPPPHPSQPAPGAPPALNHLFPSFAPPPPQFAAPPRSSFKPSIRYTSVVTTRQKK